MSHQSFLLPPRDMTVTQMANPQAGKVAAPHLRGGGVTAYHLPELARVTPLPPLSMMFLLRLMIALVPLPLI